MEREEKSKSLKVNKRSITQLVAAVLYNCNIKGFMKGSLYKGNLKGVCVPGLNCYSCPGAVASCPLGSLQSGLLSSKYKIPYYVLGLLILFGLLFGRFICGFLCPFGFLQDLLDKLARKLHLPELKKSRVTRVLSYLKYVILIAFVIIIPLVKLTPGFCKYICPVGTLEAGIPLVSGNSELREITGWLFSWKVFLMCAILLFCMLCYRAFCRFLCPLGALYSMFNPISFFGIKVDEAKCTHCNACVRACRMDVKKVCDRECIHCGGCVPHCKEGAIRYGVKGLGK
ncbi:MAG: 4Fe-4S binding protein [Lachnospiraceae bacterium]|nr:4Fe-4S binding protein [Lachnospiraceae bacterium]